MNRYGSLDRICKEIADGIADDLDRAGIFYRIFFRAKSQQSTLRKIAEKKYDGETTFMQDVIGIRINFYFVDDLKIFYDFLKNNPDCLSVTVDENETTTFKPTRINLIFKIPSKMLKEFNDLVEDSKIDKTFEIQLRTILSEGWHEVDHDLRYKCKNDWEGHDDLARLFNGILASLETSDWTTLNLFDRISYRHYRNGNFSAMLRTKFRLRLIETPISAALAEVVKKETQVSKQIYKIDRSNFIKTFLNQCYIMPMSLDNLIYLLNMLYLKNSLISKITPVEFTNNVQA